jgi:hypothetical protein
VNAQAAVAGLGRAGGTAGGGGGVKRSAHVSVARRLRIRSALRHGIRVKCRSSVAGQCSGVARYRKHTVARGWARVAASRSRRVVLKLNRRGRRTLTAARHRRLRMTVVVRVGGVKVSRRVLLVP